MAKNWEKDAEFGSDILGCGSYQFIHGGSGKSKPQPAIGFVRPKEPKAKPKIQRPTVRRSKSK